MMPAMAMSPRLPGVSVLHNDATGPQYTRWRRNIRSAFSLKDTWKHCDGSCPMPMPESGPNFFSPIASTNTQPSLLDERKAWTKKDRDVKLDLFLSVSDDVKLEVFDTAEKMPPLTMTAAQMLEALDDQFESFKFEDYHHVFCYFLNLHIDSFTSLEEFNTEFQIVLDDMEDHGHPLNNLQACSAYFSKLRCTQNPWVAKKLREWDSLPTTPLLADLMKECPPWHIIRPLGLTTKLPPASFQNSPPSFSEDLVHSPQGSSADELDQEGYETASSVSSTLEQEITVHASFEDLTEAFPVPKPQTAPLPAPTSALPPVPTSAPPPAPAPVPKQAPSPTPSSSSSLTVPRQQTKTPTPRMGSPPLNRPLPPLPSERSPLRSRSESPGPRKALENHLVPPAPLAFRPLTPSSTPNQQTLNRAHSRSPSPAPRPPPTGKLPSPPMLKADGGLAMGLGLGGLERADLMRRPSTSHGPLTSGSPLAGEPVNKGLPLRDFAREATSNFNTNSTTTTTNTLNVTAVNLGVSGGLKAGYAHSTNSSIIDLPLQGTTTTASSSTQPTLQQPTLLPQSTYSPPQPSVSSFTTTTSSSFSTPKKMQRAPTHPGTHSRIGSDSTPAISIPITGTMSSTTTEATSDKGTVIGRNWAGYPSGRGSGESNTTSHTLTTSASTSTLHVTSLSTSSTGSNGAGTVVGHLSVFEDEKRSRKRSWSFKVPRVRKDVREMI